MGLLDGKVAIITGAGNGLGEAYAKLFAKEGAAVVVNDLGGPRDGSGSDRGAAQKVVDDIIAAGGRAAANTDDVSTGTGVRLRARSRHLLRSLIRPYRWWAALAGLVATALAANLAMQLVRTPGLDALASQAADLVEDAERMEGIETDGQRAVGDDGTVVR